jgi:hypothetical protein
MYDERRSLRVKKRLFGPAILADTTVIPILLIKTATDG